MKLQENIDRIKSMMGLIIEATDKIQSNDGNVVLVADYTKNHIKTHNQFGTGSTFKEGIGGKGVSSNSIIQNI